VTTTDEKIEALEHLTIAQGTNIEHLQHDMDSCKTDTIEGRKSQNKMVFTLIALVAALVVKDIVVAGIGHTPPLELAWFWMTGMFFVGYIVWLFMYMMLWSTSRLCSTVAAMAMLIAAMFRYELGFIEGGAPAYSWFIAAPLMIGSFAFCCDAFTAWKRTWRRSWKE
jgi:hypothetical protein